MFEELDEKTQRFLVGAIFFCVFVLLLMFFRSYSPSRPTDPSRFGIKETPTPAPVIDICDTAVMGSCEVQIKEEHDDCSDQSTLRSALGSRLTNPLDDPNCKDAQLALSERCPKGCFIDYATVVLVPGKVRIDVFPAEKGPSCRVRARRSLNMQGRCVAGEAPDTAPVAEKSPEQ